MKDYKEATKKFISIFEDEQSRNSTKEWKYSEERIMEQDWS